MSYPGKSVAQGGYSYVFGSPAVSQANDYFSRVSAKIKISAFFVARMREKKFLGPFLSRVCAKKNFLGLFLVFSCFLGGVFVLFGFFYLFFAR